MRSFAYGFLMWVAFLAFEIGSQAQIITPECPCTNGEALMNQFLQAFYGKSTAATDSLPLCEFSKYYFNAYTPRGLATLQPGGNVISTRHAIDDGVQDSDVLVERNVTITNGPDCTIIADVFNPSNGTSEESRDRQVLKLVPGPANNTAACYITTVTTYACAEPAQKSCPTLLGGPPGRPLPPPTPCPCPDLRPCTGNVAT